MAATLVNSPVTADPVPPAAPRRRRRGRGALAEEEARERAADEAYWRPRLAEQAEMRSALRRGELSLSWP